MPGSNAQPQQTERLDKIREMVQKDYARIAATSDPRTVLDVEPGALPAQVRERYEQYEKFYRAENFERLGDMDLTRKALEIRRAIGRAMSALETEFDSHAEAGSEVEIALPEVDDDCAAMGDIYFRDGLTFLRLGDLNAALDCLRRAVDYDPSRGLLLAYRAYVEFKLGPNDPDVVESTGEDLRHACRMQPEDAEIHVLLCRYGINTGDAAMARRALDAVADLAPDHPKRERLERRLERKLG